MTVETIAVLPSRSFDATAAFYLSLGFLEQARYPGEYLILRHPVGVEVHFFFDVRLDPARNHAGCYVRFDSAAEARDLHDRWASAGLDGEQLRSPEPTDYGLLEFALLDIDRNLIRVGGVLGE